MTTPQPESPVAKLHVTAVQMGRKRSGVLISDSVWGYRLNLELCQSLWVGRPDPAVPLLGPCRT